MPFPHETAQHAQHLVPAAEIGELPRQEHVVLFFAGDSGLYFFAQCLALPHHPISLQKTDTYNRQKPDIWQEKQLFFRWPPPTYPALSRYLKDANICTQRALGLLCGQRAGATRLRKAMTDAAKMSFRSPATIWAAFATLIYSACGHCLRKLWAPASLNTSERPPRTKSVGKVRWFAHACNRSRYAVRSPQERRRAGSQCQ